MNPEMMNNYVLETRFPTASAPNGKPIRENLSLDGALLKADAMLAYLQGKDWEIDEPQDGGPTDWVVAKLTPNGYIVGRLSIYEGSV